jgi:hypothetical protein
MLERSCDKCICEKLNLSFARLIIGVHKKSQICALRVELELHPLGISIVCQTIKYYNCIIEGDTNSILHVALTA